MRAAKYIFLIPNFVFLLDIYLLKFLFLINKFRIKKNLLIIFSCVFLVSVIKYMVPGEYFMTVDTKQFFQTSRFLVFFFIFSAIVDIYIKTGKHFIKWLFYITLTYALIFLVYPNFMGYYNAGNLIKQNRFGGIFTNHHEIGIGIILILLMVVDTKKRFQTLIFILGAFIVLLLSGSKSGLLFSSLALPSFFMPLLFLYFILPLLILIIVKTNLVIWVLNNIMTYIINIISYFDASLSKALDQLRRFFLEGNSGVSYKTITNRIEDYHYLKVFFNQERVESLLFGVTPTEVLGHSPTFEVGIVFYVYNFGILGTLVLICMSVYTAISLMNTKLYAIPFLLLFMEFVVNVHQNFYILFLVLFMHKYRTGFKKAVEVL